jgi:hypothetical protein
MGLGRNAVGRLVLAVIDNERPVEVVEDYFSSLLAVLMSVPATYGRQMVEPGSVPTCERLNKVDTP